MRAHNPHTLRKMQLYRFQQRLLDYALERKTACLFFATGLGKTTLAVEYARRLQQAGEKVLVVCPLVMCAQYRAQLGGDGVDVVNYAKLTSHATNFTAIVLDESSILKHHCKHAKEVHALARRPGITHILALSATPAPNDPSELLRQADLLGLDSYHNLVARFFVRFPTLRLKAAAEAPFAQWLATWCMVGEKPSDAGLEFKDEDARFLLPVHTTEHVVLDNPFALVGAAATEKEKDGLAARAALRARTVPVRTEAVARLVTASDPPPSPTDQWIVWTALNAESAAVVAALERAGVAGVSELHGGLTEKQKQRAVQAFVDGETHVLVTKASVAGFGLNLQARCCRQVFTGIGESFEQFHQASRRVWRFGQTRPVSTYVVYTHDEKPIIDCVLAKAAQHDRTVQMVVGAQRRAEAPPAGEPLQTGEVYDHALGALHSNDCLAALGTVADGSVGYTLFSPPFMGLYKFSHDPRDLSNAPVAEYTAFVQALAAELLRVTAPGRHCSFHVMNPPLTSIGAPPGTVGVYDLRGLLTRCFLDAGWVLHSEVCVFRDPVEALVRTRAYGLYHKTYTVDAAKCRQSLPDYIVTMHRPVGNLVGGEPVRHEPVRHEPDIDLWKSLASCVWHVKHTRVLKVPAVPGAKKHPTPLQLDIAERCIGLWSNVGDTVCCPFGGIGTVPVVAARLGRRFVAAELNPDYVSVAKTFLAEIK